VLALSNVFHFFAHKLASLSAGRLTFALVLARPSDYFFFWHNKMFSPLTAPLDVIKYRWAHTPHQRAGFAAAVALAA
jgi:hypothetical protein